METTDGKHYKRTFYVLAADVETRAMPPRTKFVLKSGGGPQAIYF